MSMADADRTTTVALEFYRAGTRIAAGLTRRREDHDGFTGEELRGVLRLVPRLLGLGSER